MVTCSFLLQRLNPNHRVSDVLAVDNGPPPSFSGKFQYGPLAMTSLSKEEVRGQMSAAVVHGLCSVFTQQDWMVEHACSDTLSNTRPSVDTLTVLL